MKQKDKDLLLKDLCARLLYGVKCDVGDNKPYTLSRIEIDDENGHLLDFIEMKDGLDMQVYLSEVKPYLFPLSSMTEEEWKEYQTLKMTDWVKGDINGTFINAGTITDWLNKNHFDYRGLIEKGCAIDATGLNIY